MHPNPTRAVPEQILISTAPILAAFSTLVNACSLSLLHNRLAVVPLARLFSQSRHARVCQIFIAVEQLRSPCPLHSTSAPHCKDPSQKFEAATRQCSEPPTDIRPTSQGLGYCSGIVRFSHKYIEILHPPIFFACDTRHLLRSRLLVGVSLCGYRRRFLERICESGNLGPGHGTLQLSSICPSINLFPSLEPTVSYPERASVLPC